MINTVPVGGKTPVLTVKEFETMGFKIAPFPGMAWTAAIKAMQRVLKELKERGSLERVADQMVSFQEMFEVVGLSDYRVLEKKFLAF